MPRSKPITISAQLKPGRDDRLIDNLCKDRVNLSSIIREGLNLYLDKQEGKVTAFEKEVLDFIRAGKEIKPPRQSKPKSGNPFLNASP